MDQPLVLFYNGKFHIVDKVKKLDRLNPLLRSSLEINKFLSGEDVFNGFPFNSVTTAATISITFLNDALKVLARDVKQISVSVLNTLGKIFGMVCRKFDLQDGTPAILFRSKQAISNLSWIFRLVETFNLLLKYKLSFDLKNSSSVCWPIALSLLAFTCTFYLLEKAYKQDELNCLTDVQKYQFTEKFDRIHTILNKILLNLNNNQIDHFQVNAEYLQHYLENDFEPFVEEVNVHLEVQLQVLNEEKEDQVIKTVAASVVSVISFIVAVKADTAFKRAVGAAVGGATAGYALNNICRGRKLGEIIEEHKQIKDIVKGSKLFSKRMREDTDIEFDESDLLILVHQFEIFRDIVMDFRTAL
ncbi:8280_t:CDS:2, partial [Funneliformis geosporum]